MDKKYVKIAFLAIFGLLFVLTFVFIRNETGTWVCENDEWVKKGNPSAAMPLEKCNGVSGAVDNFEECLEAGFSVMESYPRQCRDGAGNLFTEEVADDRLIILDYPQPEQNISSPLKLTGRARGTWFFEASFPVILTNWDGLIIAETHATALSDWMTEDFVEFEATIDFENDNTVSNRGSLILQKDNPSGLPENDDALEITVFFE
jgi:hypothetical protein